MTNVHISNVDDMPCSQVIENIISGEKIWNSVMRIRGEGHDYHVQPQRIGNEKI
jgi:hypothetical protein